MSSFDPSRAAALALSEQPLCAPAAPSGAAALGFPAAWLFAAIALSVATSTLLLERTGLSVELWGRGELPYWLASAAAVALRLGVGQGSGWRAGRALADVAEYYVLFMWIALIGAVTSYPVAALTHGYADPMLQRVDTALHFDWVAWYRTVADHRALQLLGLAAYESIYLTPAVLLGWFAWHGERREAHRFLAAFWFSAVITLTLFSWMPAVGPFSYLWHAPIPYMPVSELWQPDLIPALRAHRMHLIDPNTLRGIVSAPSFHAAAGTVYLATAWRTRPLRWPLVALNAAMLLATPVEGTHYLADLLLGAGVALVALACASAALARVGGPLSAR